MEAIDQISSAVVGEAIRIHKDLGPGLFENVYEVVLAESLGRNGLRAATQVPVGIEYDGLRFESAFRIDILVEECLVIEVKSVEQLGKMHAKQLLTYLRLAKQPVGLLLNFSAATMKEGIRRLVNHYRPGADSLRSLRSLRETNLE